MVSGRHCLGDGHHGDVEDMGVVLELRRDGRHRLDVVDEGFRLVAREFLLGFDRVGRSGVVAFGDGLVEVPGSQDVQTRSAPTDRGKWSP